MDFDDILKKIIRRYGARTDQIRTTQLIESKLKRHAATYADAEHYAQEIGEALTDAFREYLPEALTDGRLFRAAAEVLVEQPMKTAGKDVAEVAARIQKQLNENAGIGMNAIVPEMNQDQIDGIITGICNAESYEAGEKTMFAQVENALEGYVDDFVRENADFQYKAGLNPKIERRSDGKCCAWCSALVGTYNYEDVRNRGNDVFRRHKHCHCVVNYNPGDGSGRRQNVHTRQWTYERQDDMIAFAAAGTEKPNLESAQKADLDRTRWEKINPNRMRRIQNGFSAFPEGDVLNQYAKEVKPYKNYFDVAMHGSPDAVGFGSKTMNMKAKDLANIIRRDQAYDGGPVRLLCCKTGLKINDEYCFAEELANALGQIVRAPDDDIIIYEDGSFKVGDRGDGHLEDYAPNERRRLR